MARKAEKAGEDPGNKLKFDKQKEGEIYDEDDKPRKVISLFYKGGSSFSMEVITKRKKLTDLEIDEIGELAAYLLRNEEIDNSIGDLLRSVETLRESLEDLFAEDAEGQLNETGINESRLQKAELHLAQEGIKALKKLKRLGVIQIEAKSYPDYSIKVEEDIKLFESRLERLKREK